MAKINPYLIFNGNCEEAFLFYQSVFGNEFKYFVKFKDMPAENFSEEVSEEDADKIIHVALPIGKGTVLMGSDSNAQSNIVRIGNNFSISINTESREEADALFNGLSFGGKVFIPMNVSFWGAYFGMLEDKFGVNWMVNFDETPQV